MMCVFLSSIFAICERRTFWKSLAYYLRIPSEDLIHWSLRYLTFAIENMRKYVADLCTSACTWSLAHSTPMNRHPVLAKQMKHNETLLWLSCQVLWQPSIPNHVHSSIAKLHHVQLIFPQTSIFFGSKIAMATLGDPSACVRELHALQVLKHCPWKACSKPSPCSGVLPITFL